MFSIRASPTSSDLAWCIGTIIKYLKYIYSECLDGIGKFKDFDYHIELDPNKPRVEIPHEVTLSVEFGLKKE